MPSWNGMEFTRKQMMVIAIGLEEGMDITPYAKPEFDDNQMWMIKHGIDTGLDYEVYSKFDESGKPIFDSDQMS